jgi:hypothetical protein
MKLSELAVKLLDEELLSQELAMGICAFRFAPPWS